MSISSGFSHLSTLIFGAGAIGQWLGALLVSSGTKVQLHGREAVAEAVQKQGGVVLNGGKPQQVKFSYNLEQLKGQSFDTVVSTVKTFAVESALGDLVDAQLDFQNLVSFQNGWGTEEHYLKAFPEKNFWALTTTRAVGVEGPGRLTPSTKGGLAIAPWNANPLLGIPEGLRKVKIPLARVERGVDLKWSKLVLNIIGNATGAITGLSPSHLANHPQIMKTEMQLVRECMAVGRAMGIRRVDLPGFPIQLLSGALEKLPIRVVTPVIAAKMRRARGDKLPSLFADLEDPTRPTEIDHLNGAVVAEGEKLGISTPKQKALVSLFHRCRRDQELWQRIRREPTVMLEFV